MKALISPNERVYYTEEIPYTITDPETGEVEKEGVAKRNQDIPNAARIAQIEENEFEVGGDLFWVDCDNTIDVDTHYYDTSDNTFKIKSDYSPS